MEKIKKRKNIQFIKKFKIKDAYSFLFKIIIFLLFIFSLEKKPKLENFNINLNISSILSSKYSINNSNISTITSPTNLLNTWNISTTNIQTNINKAKNQNMKLNYEFTKYKEYFQNSKEGKILYEENLVYSQNPLISVVISLYNDEKYINATLKSVQNQKMKDFEIILVDDYSTDNSVKYVEEVQKKDPRIVLIQNKKNMGILYSKSIGVLKARGKYIFPLDDDDMIIIDVLFDYIYEEIEMGKYDIVEFSWIESSNYDLFEKSLYTKPFCVHSLDKVIYQPELRRRFNRNENGKLHFPDRFLWGKIFSKELYIKSIKAFGEDLKQKITAHEDTIMTFMLFKFGNSFKKIGKIGIIHFLLPKTTTDNMYSNNKIESTCTSFVNYIDILYKNIENTTMAKEDALHELTHWILQSKCNYNKYGLEKKINITKKFYDDSMIPRYRKFKIENFLKFITKLNINNNITI